MDVFQPSKGVLITLGNIARHTEELLSLKGHSFYRTVLKVLLEDAELKEWMVEMDKLALLPVRR